MTPIKRAEPNSQERRFTLYKVNNTMFRTIKLEAKEFHQMLCWRLCDWNDFVERNEMNFYDYY